jgi:glycosyltransferase involved in cell wall biosynthesis
VTDATILIPTHRHAAFLPFAIRSALDQDGASVEVFAVGDGVEGATREVVEELAVDARLRFFDFPKGPRYGEVHRHRALAEATGRVVCYLEDDDLLLPDHVATMVRLLEHADFAHSAPAWIEDTGRLVFEPWNMARPEFAWLMRTGRGSVGLTGAAHTLVAYRRLPHGWRTTPPELPTDRYMWLQWLDLPGFRGVTSDRLTHLHFPEHQWRRFTDGERARFLDDWLRRSREPGFTDELDAMLGDAVRRAGEDLRIHARELELSLGSIRATRWWRLRAGAARSWPLQRLRAIRREDR